MGELKAIGANAVRSQHPLEEGLLERLDAAGILVWQGSRAGRRGRQLVLEQPPAPAGRRAAGVRTAVLAAELHPSIVAWNLLNEVAGNGRSAGEVGYVQTLTGWLHANDPTRMVAVDVWGDHYSYDTPVRSTGGVDAVAETDYTGW